MKEKIISQGAEATIYKIENKVVKERLPKKYRLEELDNKIRIRRTKKEAKIMTKASEIANVPKPFHIPDKSRTMHLPFIEGKKLSEHLDNLSEKELKNVCEEIGSQILKLHENNIIHGDLTTSNMILKENKVWLIDFGLGYISERLEDKAVDLHVIRQAFESKHYKNYEKCWKYIEKAYSKSDNSKQVLERLKIVESRGRYKDKY